jgi:hypothetical protein
VTPTTGTVGETISVRCPHRGVIWEAWVTKDSTRYVFETAGAEHELLKTKIEDVRVGR